MPPGTTPHPLLTLVADFETQVDGALSTFEPGLWPVADKRVLLLGLTRLMQRLELLRGRVLFASFDVAAQPGARNAVDWLAHATSTAPGPHHRALRLAERLQQWCLVHEAVEDGRVNPDQAVVIVAALDKLLHPDVELGDARDEITEAAQRLLIIESATKSPAELKVLGGRILDLVAPIVGESEEARRLTREEAKAHAATHLHLFPLGNGLTRLEGHLPDADALRLKTLLEAYTNPRRPCTCGTDADAERRGDTADPFAHDQGCAAHASSASCRAPGDVRDSAQRRGAALCQLVRSIDPTSLPTQGGEATTLVVTITLDELVKKLGVGALDDGSAISAAHARELACNAGLIPAVLGSQSEVLDLGRSTRLFSPAQRRALQVRHKTCQAEGCTIPARWCDAHHVTWWQHHGPTDLANASLLCGFHHHRVHDPAYAHHQTPDGTWAFTRLRQ